jgi:ABC-2 type transport system permease protein
MTTMLEPAAQRVTLAGVLRSEWTKLRTLPSTAWSLLATAALVVGFGAIYATLRVTRPPHQPAEIAAFDPISVSLAGVQLAQLAIGILGVLLITGEYATGSIRTSLAAVPRRLPLLWGKAVTLGLTTLALCIPATFAAFLVGQSILSSEHLDTTLSQPGAARAVLGGALYLTAIGLLGLGLGALLRSTAGGIAALFGLLFAPQVIVGFLPGTWSDQVARYLPVPAGVAVTSARPDAASLGPWTGFGLLCLYVSVVLGLAAWRLRRRDA